MALTLIFPELLSAELRAMLADDRETAAVILARRVETSRGAQLLVREVLRVPSTAYAKRDAYELVVTSDGYVPALGRAEATDTIPIWFHTHPGIHASPAPSSHDNVVDSQLGNVFRIRAGTGYYGALIFAGVEQQALQFTGFLESDDNERVQFDRVVTVGRRLEVAFHHGRESPGIDAVFDRNVRAFGGGVQAALGAMRIAVVGCGGTGSAVAEQLVRLGVRQLTLVDPDHLSASNVTRVYGSTAQDVGRPKVTVLAEHLVRIAPTAVIEEVESTISLERTARKLVGVDVVFGCTDDNAGRLVLSRFAIYFLVPLIDCGVLLTSDPEGRLNGIFGRVTLVRPGDACLVCRDRVDLGRARTELLTPEERIRRADEGYAPALPGIEPAVVTFTTAVAAAAVGELLELLTGFGPDHSPSEILLRLHDREISTNVAKPRPKHYCDPATNHWGKGATDPFLGQVWPS